MKGYKLNGVKLRTAREAARLSREELGARCGLKSGWTIGALERDARGASMELVRELERALNVSAADLGADLPQRADA